MIACEQQFVDDIRKARTLRFISTIAQLEHESFFESNKPFSGAPLSTASSGTLTNIGGFSVIGGLFGGAYIPPPTASIPANTKAASPSGSLSDPKPETSSLKTTCTFSSLPDSKPEATQMTFKTLTEFAKTNRSKLNGVLADDRQLMYEIHDTLKVYYAISVQNYTDMVCKNRLDGAFTNCIMNLFSKEFVDRLSDSEIFGIAAESPADRKRRRELKEDVEKLEVAISEPEAILSQPLRSD